MAFGVLEKNGTKGGGRARKPAAAAAVVAGSWRSTGRKMTLRDGSVRVLYSHPGKPGDLRVKKMVASRRNGARVATYVRAKP